MKYLWIVMLIVGEIAWIRAMIMELKENKEFLEEFYPNDKTTYWDIFREAFTEIKFTFFFTVTHVLLTFIISLMMYTVK